MTEKVVIFDWGRTLYDNDNEDLFPGVLDLLEYLSYKYKLCIASLATDGNFEKRLKIIHDNGLGKYFRLLKFSADNKDKLYEEILAELDIGPEDVTIVDDRTVRGIRWGNNNGCTTVWIKNGKFSVELPNADTGLPTYTITDIRTLAQIL